MLSFILPQHPVKYRQKVKPEATGWRWLMQALLPCRLAVVPVLVWVLAYSAPVRWAFPPPIEILKAEWVIQLQKPIWRHPLLLRHLPLPGK